MLRICGLICSNSTSGGLLARPGRELEEYHRLYVLIGHVPNVYLRNLRLLFWVLQLVKILRNKTAAVQCGVSEATLRMHAPTPSKDPQKRSILTRRIVDNPSKVRSFSGKGVIWTPLNSTCMVVQTGSVGLLWVPPTGACGEHQRND